MSHVVLTRVYCIFLSFRKRFERATKDIRKKRGNFIRRFREDRTAKETGRLLNNSIGRKRVIRIKFETENLKEALQEPRAGSSVNFSSNGNLAVRARFAALISVIDVSLSINEGIL